MSLINDIKEEKKLLRYDENNLRKFGLIIGGIFLIAAFYFLFIEVITYVFWILIITGAGLLVSGLVAPKRLRYIYEGWMTGAIILGWFVSRFILTLIFYLIITPIGLIAKVTGKKFLDTEFKSDDKSYWIIKKSKTKYDKMY